MKREDFLNVVRAMKEFAELYELGGISEEHFLSQQQELLARLEQQETMPREVTPYPPYRLADDLEDPTLDESRQPSLTRETQEFPTLPRWTEQGPGDTIENLVLPWDAVQNLSSSQGGATRSKPRHRSHLMRALTHRELGPDELEEET